MDKNTTCLGCEERHQGCHDKCEKYLAWKKEKFERQQKIYKAKRESALMRFYEVERISRMKKQKGNIEMFKRRKNKEV